MKHPLRTSALRSRPLPPLLQAKVSHAQRLARTLGALQAETSADDAPFLWLQGRGEEVRVFTLDVVDAWSSGDLTPVEAAGVIEGYLQALHGSLEGWYGRWYAPSCCGPLSCTPASGIRPRREPRVRRRTDSLADTLADAPAADLAAHRRVRIGGVGVMGG